MITLAIETSNPSVEDGAPGVALMRTPDSTGDAEIIDTEDLREARRQDDDLVGAIDRLFQRAGIEANTIERVAVSVGPGGYTAVRMAVAAGRMIAMATSARCVAVPSALSVMWNVDESDFASGIGVALAGKGDSAWVTVFPNGWREHAANGTVPAGRLMNASDMSALEGCSTFVADRHIPEAMRNTAADIGLHLQSPTFTARACALASAGLPDVKPDLLEPIYPREPDAVRLWRQRHCS